MHKISFFLFINLFILVAVFIDNAQAKNISNDDILQNIEKSLLFDKSEAQEVNFYRNQSKKGDSLVIERAPNRNSKNKPVIDVSVTDVKIDNDAIRQSLNNAYNLSLIDQNEAAIEIYKEVLTIKPDDEYSKFSLAVLYQKMNQNNQAKNLYHELLENDPENKHQIISNLLSILIEESSQEAIYFLSRLHKQNPKSSYITAQLGLAYEKLENYDLAAEYLEKAKFIDSNNLEYIYNLAVIYDKMEESEKALKSYKIVIRNYSDDYNSIPISLVKDRVKFLKISSE